MKPAATPACAFGPFELDPSEHRLLREGRPVPVTPKVFDVLCVLVRHHGRLVSKEQLLDEVWPGTFVDEANLNRSVHMLRKVLGERAGDPYYIETVPKLGYRFVASVTPRPDTAPEYRPDPPLVLAAGTPPPRRRSNARRSAAVVITAVGAGLLAYGTLGRSASDPPAGRAVIAPSHRQLTFTGQEGLPTISPDGTRLAYVSSTASTKRVMVRGVEGGEPIEIITGSGAGFLRWSPTGDALMFWARTPQWEGVHVMITPGETPRRIARGRYVACWSPDGTTIVVASYINAGLTFYDRESREQRRATIQGDHFWVWDIDWSATDDRLLMTTSNEEGRFTVATLLQDGREQRMVFEDHAEIATARWASRGEAIVYSRRANQAVSLFRLPMEQGGRREGATPSALLTGLEMDRSFGITADGRHLVYTRAPYHSNLWRLDLGEAGQSPHVRTQPLTNGTSLIERPRVSPDGTSVVFNMGREALANLYSVSIDGGTPTPVTQMQGFSVGGTWSADGAQIAFASTKDAVSRVWTVGASGGQPRAVFTGEMSDTFDLAWYPGRHILFQRPGNRDYVELDLEGGTTRPLVKNSSVGWIFSPVPSPDGRRLAVMWNRRDGRGLWTIDRESGREQLVHRTAVDSLTPIGWSVDGTAIFAVEGRAAVYRGLVLPSGETITGARILRIPLGEGEPQPVVTLPFEEIGGVSMTRDGRRFVCTVYASASDVWIVDLLGVAAG